MQTITAVLDIRTSNYYTLIHTGIKYDVLISTTKRRLTIILVYYTNVLCREEKGCNNIISHYEEICTFYIMIGICDIFALIVTRRVN